VPAHPSGRDYFRVYRARRADELAFLLDAVSKSGGRCLAHTGANLAPIHLAIDEGDGVLVGALAYLFSAGHHEILHRPPDEHRLQIKYGDITERWRRQKHQLGFDPAGLDVTLVLAVHAEVDLIIGLDPLLYDPLPMGIQIGFKDTEVQAAINSGWHVWERETRPGRRRDPRATGGLETIVAFAPDRLIDYIALERQAQTMRLDPALRFRAAESAASGRASVKVHDLERAYDLSAAEILEIVSERSRLAMALRGGVAEHHLGRLLESDRLVSSAEVGQQEGPPDFWVTLSDGRELTIECKNASPKTYADGTPKVEIQKTRASRGDPLSRLYPLDAFDVIAVCMYGPTGKWDFKFKRTADLVPHSEHPTRIAPLQRVDETWSDSLADVI
jgi:restriction-modification system family protein